uniref:Uncharacterized protein n=1 Tax=Heliothis virescens TaxID=7102 RepID=A0A2A4JCI7_HELVI
MEVMFLDPQDEGSPAEEMRARETNTEYMKIIRDEWGTQGTMNKIMKHLMSDARPVTIKTLIAAGPVVPGHSSVIAATCFSSLAKLKEQGYISIIKDPNTLEITDVILSIERFGTDHYPHALCEHDIM